MDNFFCSHRCTSYVHFGQGRVSVCALARSARSFCRSLTLLATALTPIMFGLVLPDLRNICVVPKSNLHPSERFSGRCLNPILSNPAVKSTRSNSKQLGYLNCRIRLHNSVPYIICQGKKNVPGRAHFACAPIRATEEYRISRHIRIRICLTRPFAYESFLLVRSASFKR
jgi:hypothetical protein